MTTASWHPPTVTYSRERQDDLAKPKRVPPAFLQDRRSVYWVDKEPAMGPTKFSLTRRQQELMRNRTHDSAYIPDRTSPMWLGTLAAMIATPSKRICQLAKPKPFHHEWVAMRSLDTRISLPALDAATSERLEKLARPKIYEPLPIKSDSDWDWEEWASPAPKEVKDYVPSARLEQLAEPKSCSAGFMDNRSVVWRVTKSALQTQATARLEELARPKTRRALDQDYDPYGVSLAARMAVPSPRVEQLAVPISRKVRNKKSS